MTNGAFFLASEHWTWARTVPSTDTSDAPSHAAAPVWATLATSSWIESLTTILGGMICAAPEAEAGSGFDAAAAAAAAAPENDADDAGGANPAAPGAAEGADRLRAPSNPLSSNCSRNEPWSAGEGGTTAGAAPR
jgi:hypothetical protein